MKRKIIYVRLLKLPKNNKKKYVAYFRFEKTPGKHKIKTIYFGQNPYEDYTIHKDDKRKQKYLSRHKNEDWNNPVSAGTLARYILWNKKTLTASINDYKKKFRIPKIIYDNN